MLSGEIPPLGDLWEQKPPQCAVRKLPTLLNTPKDNALESSEEKRRQKEQENAS